MIRFKAPEQGLALPTSTPMTLIEVDSNIPYACQCPCCGEIFQIPDTLLYKIEDDNFLDGDSDAEFEGSRGSRTTPGGDYSDFGDRDFESNTSFTEVASEPGGEDNGSVV